MLSCTSPLGSVVHQFCKIKRTLRYVNVEGRPAAYKISQLAKTNSVPQNCCNKYGTHLLINLYVYFQHIVVVTSF